VAPEEQGQVTQLLAKWAQGDRGALDSLMPMVYRDLREMRRITSDLIEQR